MLLPLTLAACAVSRADKIADGKDRYLAAKDACVAAYPSSLTRQSDCRTRAADEYVRPWYRYPDLMTRAQEMRRELAVQVDAHKITRARFDRQMAKAERTIAREEARRNEMARLVSNHDDGPAGAR